MIDDQQSEWKRHRWQKMNTRFLREETNKQLDIVKGLPDDVLTWDVYMGLHESITTIQVSARVRRQTLGIGPKRRNSVSSLITDL